MSSSRRRGPFFLVGTACCPVASLGSLAPLSPRAFAGFAAPGALSIPRPRRRQPHRHRRLLLVLEISGAASSSWSAADPMLRISVGHADRIASRLRRLPPRVPLASASPACPANRTVLRDGPGGGPVPGHRRRLRRTALPTPAPSPSRSGRDNFFVGILIPAPTVPVSVTRAASNVTARSSCRRKKFTVMVAVVNRFPVRSIGRTELSHRRELLLVPLPVGATVALPVRVLHRVACRSLSRVASRSPLKRRRAPSLRSTGVPNHPWCAPRSSPISTPGGVFSHTRRT